MASKNPYVGLRPFNRDESFLFFGRESQTLELLQRLHEHSFVAVVGSSGSGKSSLLRAGLIPALNGGFLVNNSDVWKVASMMPGQHPLYNLAEAILKEIHGSTNSNEVQELVKKIGARGATAIVDLIIPLRKKEQFNFFLLVDQFEEIFRFSMTQKDSEKKDVAIDFVDVFLELAAQKIVPFYVVLTMRSDFIGDCAQFYGLPEAMNKSQYLVPRLTREQLKKVIEGPAKLFGGKFDSALTSILLNHIGEVEDELPVLQHALMRMWDYESHIDKNESIDLRDYHSIGGIHQALSKHADEAYKELLSPADKKIAKGLFQGLTTVDDHGRKIRHPEYLSNLSAKLNVSTSRLLEIIDRFIRDNRSFLVVYKLGDTDDKLIDISHESLIRQWGRLGKWVDQENENATIYGKLIAAKKEYDFGNKGLLDNLELQKFVEWRNGFKPTESWAERYASGYKENMAYIVESEKKQRKKRTARRWLYAAITLIVFAAIFTFVGRNIRERNKDYAFRLHENAQIQVARNPTKALLLEMAAYNVQKNETYKDSALSIYNGNNSFYKIKDRKSGFSLNWPNDKVLEEVISPTYDKMLTRYASGVIHLLDIQGRILMMLTKESDRTSMVFSSDGSKFVIGDAEGYVTVYDVERVDQSLENPGEYSVNPDIYDYSVSMDTLGITSMAFSNDNRRLATGNEAGDIIIWDTEGNALQDRDLTASTEYSVTTLKFSPNDSLIFASSFLNSAVISSTDQVELTTGRYDESGLLNVAAFHPELDLVVTGGKDQKVRLWNIKENSSSSFSGHKSEVNFVDFLLIENHTFIVSGSLNNNIYLWNQKGQLLQQFLGHEGFITSVQVNEDGTAIISKSLDLTTRIWPLNSDVIKEVYDTGRSNERTKFERLLRNSPPELSLDQFLESEKIENSSFVLKNEYLMN